MTVQKNDDRQAIAFAKIKSLYGTPEGEFGPTLFVSHHLEEIENADWMKALGREKPNPDQVLNALILVDQWASNDDDVIDTYDFSLPGDITNYLLSVRFDEQNQIDEISMES